MSNLRFSLGLVGLVLGSALPTLGVANTYNLRRDDVIPVVFKDSLTVRDNRPGDSFTVHVTDNGMLPVGTDMLGRIDRIHPARGNHPASMDLRFTDILLPDRSRVPLDAAPIALDDKYITRYGDGRIVAKQSLRQQQTDVLGGAIGGYIVGSIFHRRIAGTIIGTMIGISAAESERAKDANLVVSAGDKVGALINHDVTIDFDQLQPRYGINSQLDQRMADPVDGRRVFGNIVLTFHNNDIGFPDDARPYRIGRTIMVPLEPMARQLRLDVDRRPDRTIYVDGPDRNIRLTISSREARLDGKRFDLPRTVVEFKGVVYVPLEALVQVLKDDLFLNGTRFPAN